MNGFFLVDKPPDVTSFDCVKILRKLCQEKRIGFVGTLDPLATGLMLFAIGEMRKLLPYLEGLDKSYETVIHFGATSDTYDAKGKITQANQPQPPTRLQIEQSIFEYFLGEREQQPPVFSAIQIQGKRAYDLARKGKKVELEKRKVTFFEVKVLDYSWPLVSLRVHCSNGTYIRSLAHDLGQHLSCGGYVEKLRRLSIGPFLIEKAVPLSHITLKNIDTFLLNPSDIFPTAPQINLTQEQYAKLSNGSFIFLPLDSSLAKHIPALAYFQNKCVGILEAVPHQLGYIKFARQFLVS